MIGLCTNHLRLPSSEQQSESTSRMHIVDHHLSLRGWVKPTGSNPFFKHPHFISSSCEMRSSHIAISAGVDIMHAERHSCLYSSVCSDSPLVWEMAWQQGSPCVLNNMYEQAVLWMGCLAVTKHIIKIQEVWYKIYITSDFRDTLKGWSIFKWLLRY